MNFSSEALGPPLDEFTLCTLAHYWMHQKVQYRRNPSPTSSAPLSASSSVTLKVQPQVHLLMCLCRLLNASLRAALKYCQVHYHCTDKSTINFLCSFKCSLEWDLRYTFNCSIECYLNFTIYWIILYSLMNWKLHEKMKLKCNLKRSF